MKFVMKGRYNFEDRLYVQSGLVNINGDEIKGRIVDLDHPFDSSEKAKESYGIEGNVTWTEEGVLLDFFKLPDYYLTLPHHYILTKEIEEDKNECDTCLEDELEFNSCSDLEEFGGLYSGSWKPEKTGTIHQYRPTFEGGSAYIIFDPDL